MCLVIKKHTQRRTASKPIKVWKLLGVDNTSPFYNHVYFPNQTYVAKFSFSYDVYDNKFVESGLHAYCTLDGAEYFRFPDEYIVQMTIPKGAHYYLGSLGDIVTDTIESGDLVLAQFR